MLCARDLRSRRETDVWALAACFQTIQLEFHKRKAVCVSSQCVCAYDQTGTAARLTLDSTVISVSGPAWVWVQAATSDFSRRLECGP